MIIDKALILAAGKGTRMGQWGKQYPKALFKVFEKTLLELQLCQCHELGLKKVFINAHHQHQKIKDFLSSKDFSKIYDLEITLLTEENLLGSGGAIHNLQSCNEFSGHLLTLNADQLFFFNHRAWLEDIEKNSFATNLLALNVGKDQGYNFLSLENKKLTRIIPYEEGIDIDLPITFSGNAFINLDKINFVEGESSFFKTVANFNENDIFVHQPIKEEYWDFGTWERYCESILNLLTSFEENLNSQAPTNPSEILKFFEKYKVINLENFDEKKKEYQSKTNDEYSPTLSIRHNQVELTNTRY